jgi:deoxyribodipyrimidine photolyase-related protein
MEPAERELRADLAPLVAEGLLEVLPHEGWLTTREQFLRLKGPPWRMDAFYRGVRRETGILMRRGKAVGGRFSFDAENRKRWTGEPEPPEAPRFRPDQITREVAGLVEARVSDHPGRVDLDRLPTTQADASRIWRWALGECLPHFGPYEDAMTRSSGGLFHTRISALLNLHRLLPRKVLGDVLGHDIPFASKEGFVRQVLGWREFVRHVHRETDGFRKLGATGAPSFLEASDPLPAAYWGKPSGLFCLDHVVEQVWAEGWSHHITRLMVLSNLATLLEVSPRELTDGFWVGYIDAYDWVVEPNVLAMGTFAVGEVMTTKPYVSGAAYISRMSDFCGASAFDPRTNCPITPLYRHFLNRKRVLLESNPRMALALRAAGKRSPQETSKDRRVFVQVKAAMAEGEPLVPDQARSRG